MIYPIGYQRLVVEQLDAILAELDAALVDVRSAPTATTRPTPFADGLRLLKQSLLN